MLFNSFSFLIFLPIVYSLYWLIQQVKGEKQLLFQNTLLLIASYIFYSFWSIQFCLLLIFSTLLDYFSGQKIHESKSVSEKKLWLSLSIGINLSLLGFLKYANFFIENTISLAQTFGYQLPIYTLQIMLPIGISFYTFHGISYLIDIFKEKTQPE